MRPALSSYIKIPIPNIIGHNAGNALLIELAKIMLSRIRKIDLAVRYGGEEFLIIVPGTDIKVACEVAERIRETVENSLETTISIGIASCKEGVEKGENIIREADSALYRAKEKGRNRVEIST